MNEAGTILLISLLTAHLIGDFVLQTGKDVADKTKPLIFTKHILIITALSYMFCGLWTEWRIPLLILITHSFLDWLKITFFNSGNSDKKQLTVFLADQFLHFIVIVLVALYIQNGITTSDIYWLKVFPDNFNNALVLISAVILLTKPGSIIIGSLVSPFLHQMDSMSSHKENPEFLRGFVNGGRVIGYLERILIFIFIYLGNSSAVGFLIAAKAVFRFGELSNRNNRMEAEYIIIGTLYSFVYALLICYGVIKLLSFF